MRRYARRRRGRPVEPLCTNSRGRTPRRATGGKGRGAATHPTTSRSASRPSNRPRNSPRCARTSTATRSWQILGIGPGRQVGAAYNHLLELRVEHGPMTEERATAALAVVAGAAGLGQPGPQVEQAAEDHADADRCCGQSGVGGLRVQDRDEDPPDTRATLTATSYRANTRPRLPSSIHSWTSVSHRPCRPGPANRSRVRPG